MELTKIGVENLLDTIEKHIIKMPTEPMSSTELECWLKGYSQAQFTIMQLIDDIFGAQK